MFCRQCEYPLERLQDTTRTCPECGKTFDPADPKTYQIELDEFRTLRRWGWRVAGVLWVFPALYLLGSYGTFAQAYLHAGQPPNVYTDRPTAAHWGVLPAWMISNALGPLFFASVVAWLLSIPALLLYILLTVIRGHRTDNDIQVERALGPGLATAVLIAMPFCVFECLMDPLWWMD